MADDNFDMIRGVDDPCWQFPAGFYGTHLETKRYCKTAYSFAIKQGTWKTFFDEAEVQSVLNLNADILLSHHPSWYPNKSRYWRLGNLMDVLHDQLEKGVENDRLLQLKKGIIGSLWGTLIMLEPFSWSNFPSRYYGQCFSGEWPRQVLSSIVYWLPEMEYIRHRISNTSPSDNLFSFGTNIFWCDSVYSLLRHFGYEIDVEYAKKALDSKAGPLSEELLRHGVIERVGDRFILRI